jgi:hypothetical protein
MRRWRIVIAGAACIATSLTARADTIGMHGSDLPMKRCQIQDIKLGRVYFRDVSGRRRWSELDDVRTIGFDGLPALDEAEAMLAAGDADGGLYRMLQALLNADRPLEEVWVRVRLVQLHESRGEFISAAGHAAAVFVLTEDGSWRSLEPFGNPDRPSFAAASESLRLLERAKRELDSPGLYAATLRMLEVVRPVHDRLARAPGAVAPRFGTTHSGLDIATIRAYSFAADAIDEPPAAEPPPDPAAETEPAPAAVPPPRTAAPSTGGVPDADAIDALLDVRRTADALAACKRAAETPGQRSLSRLLHQYGRSLAGEGNPRDAAVMFVRAAVLYPRSAYAAPSLLETAVIYRDTYGDHRTARRLAERAVELSTSAHEVDIALGARDILDTLSVPEEE